MVYPVTKTGAQATISAVEKRIHSIGILQSIVHDRGTVFINTEFINWTKEMGSTLRPELRTRSGLTGRSKPRINILPDFGGTFRTMLRFLVFFST